jgi:hypothetical protein
VLARFVFPHALISLHLNGVYPHFSLSQPCSTNSLSSLFMGFMSTLQAKNSKSLNQGASADGRVAAPVQSKAA